MDVPPVLQSIWIANHAERDASTGTLTVSGIFDQLVMEPDADTFRGPFVLYFGVSGLHGAVWLQLQFTQVDTNEVMIDRPVLVEETDPRSVVDVMVCGKEMPVPEPGAYVWELFHNGTALGTSRLWVRRKGEDE